jgi:hypothetical protein
MSGYRSRYTLRNTPDLLSFVMDTLTLFGLFAVTAMLLFYALEDRSRWFILAFAAACALASIYGFLQGAWPFGMVEAIWTVVALQRWRTRARDQKAKHVGRISEA